MKPWEVQWVTEFRTSPVYGRSWFGMLSEKIQTPWMPKLFLTSLELYKCKEKNEYKKIQLSIQISNPLSTWISDTKSGLKSGFLFVWILALFWFQVSRFRTSTVEYSKHLKFELHTVNVWNQNLSEFQTQSSYSDTVWKKCYWKPNCLTQTVWKPNSFECLKFILLVGFQTPTVVWI